MVTVLPYSKPARSGSLRALSPNIHWHPIALAEAERGSRPNASPSSPSWWWGLTVTARPAHSWRSRVRRWVEIRRSGIHHAWW